MNGSRTAWAMTVVLSVAGAACGTTVAVESTGAGGGGSASSAAGGAGGVADGSGGVGGASVGGMGPSAGGGSVGGMGPGGAGGAGGAGGGGVGGSMVCPGFGDDCTECLSAECAAVWCGCYGEAHCGGYLECLGTCMPGDTECAQSCATVHEAGISAAALTADCAGTTCDAGCAAGKALMPCQKCLYTECSNEMNACLANPECVALVQCIQACAPGDMACGQACADEHPSGLLQAVALRNCRIENCDESCP